MLQRALPLDPQYAAAYVELAYAIHTRALQRGEEQAVVPTIRPLIEKALGLDPQSGAARVTRGSLLMREDAAAAEAEMRAGLALAPSHARGYEILAGQVGFDPARTDEAPALIEQALALDPLSPRNHHMKGILLWTGKGEFVAARAHFARALEIEPRFRNALFFLVVPSMMAGEFAAAADYAERLLELDPDDPQTRELLVLQYLNIGDLAAALDALERAFRTARPFWWILLDGNAVFDPLREEPRYRALRARLDEHLQAERALLAEKRRSRGAGPDGAAVVPPGG